MGHVDALDASGDGRFEDSCYGFVFVKKRVTFFFFFFLFEGLSELRDERVVRVAADEKCIVVFQLGGEDGKAGLSGFGGIFFVVDGGDSVGGCEEFEMGL